MIWSRMAPSLPSLRSAAPSAPLTAPPSVPKLHPRGPLSAPVSPVPVPMAVGGPFGRAIIGSLAAIMRRCIAPSSGAWLSSGCTPAASMTVRRMSTPRASECPGFTVIIFATARAPAAPSSRLSRPMPTSAESRPASSSSHSAARSAAAAMAPPRFFASGDPATTTLPRSTRGPSGAACRAVDACCGVDGGVSPASSHHVGSHPSAPHSGHGMLFMSMSSPPLSLPAWLLATSPTDPSRSSSSGVSSLGEPPLSISAGIPRSAAAPSVAPPAFPLKRWTALRYCRMRSA